MTHLVRLLALAMATLAMTSAYAADGLAPGEILRGRFVQERHLQGFAAPVRSQGRFVIVAGQGFIWQVETPFRVTTAMSRSGVAQIADGVETLRLSPARAPGVARVFEALAGSLAGDWQRLETEFAVTREEQGAQTRLTAVPRDAAALGGVVSVSVHVRGFVERIELARAGGDRDVIVFQDQVWSAETPSADEAALLAATAR